MAETQKKSVEEYLTEHCQNLSSLWGSMIQVRCQKSKDTYYILVGPDSIYRDSDIFVSYQRSLLKNFKELWPGKTLIIQGFESIPNTETIYDNTRTTSEG
jgi:hypothetical protein